MKLSLRANASKICITILILFVASIVAVKVAPIKRTYLATLADLSFRNLPQDTVDAIFTLSFEPERLEKSLAWKKKLPSAKWIISLGKNKDSLTQRYKNMDLETFFRKNNIALAENVFRIDSTRKHTFEESRLIDSLSIQYGFHEVLIISAPYHMKRVRFICERLRTKANHASYYYDYPDWDSYLHNSHDPYLYDSYHRRIWKDPLSMHPLFYCWRFLLKELVKSFVYKLRFNQN
jgi:uncharacterized SAM-binding protein YcdF (DUF218 family)